MQRTVRLASMLALAALSAGCLVGESRHTLYLDPDGSVQWVVWQRDVRSDAGPASERRVEERRFLEAARSGEHPVASALEQLEPVGMESRVHRDEAPFVVATSADFRSIERLAWTFIERLGVEGRVELERDGSRTRFRMSLATESAAGGSDDRPDDSGALLALIADTDDYRLWLTEGRFVEAEGFRLEQDGRVAVPVEPDDRGDGVLVLALSWEE